MPRITCCLMLTCLLLLAGCDGDSSTASNSPTNANTTATASVSPSVDGMDYLSRMSPEKKAEWDGPPAGTKLQPTFTFINRGDIGTLDPQDMSWMQDIRIAYGLWEGIYTLDPLTLKPIPGAAESVDVSDDGKVYTFHLRPDGKWSNGDPLTAQDFVFSWRRLLEQPGDYSYLLYYIKGAEDYLTRFSTAKDKAALEAVGATFADSVGIRAIDSKTFEVTLTNSTPFFPDVAAFPTFFPLNQKSMEPFKQVNGATGRVTYDVGFTKPGTLVTNGPYILDKWQIKDRVVIKANPNYHDPDQVLTKEIIALTIEDPNLALQRYDRKEVDWLTDLEGEQAALMKEQGREDVYVFPSFGTYFYTFNCEARPDGSPNPFTDVKVRQALAKAINKSDIVQYITKAGELATDVYVPPAFAGYESPQGLTYDVEAARQLLADAGFPGGKGFTGPKIVYNSDAPIHAKVAQYISKQWKDNLGIDVPLQPIEGKQFQSLLQEGDFQVARASWYGDYNDISTFLDKYLSSSVNNDASWISPDYDKLVKSSSIELDSAKRMSEANQAETLLLEGAPIIPLYHYVNKMAHRDNVKGISQNPRMMFMLHRIWVAE